ncbi:MAG TPA: hypothetical protein VFQ39_18665 [Longimicrobium sp.]|nr:hypothetical protein [Longimicrobium sp.]
MRFDEFERRAREMFDSIPPEMQHGVEYLVVDRDAVPHPDLPDVYTLGECATGELDLGFDGTTPVRSGVHLYHGSFRELARLDPEFDWEGELWETLTHEIRHHRESTAGEDDLEDFDHAADENFKRRDGRPFDPWFYRSGEPVADGAWEVDGDLFVELPMTPERFAAVEEIEAEIAGERVTVPRPDRLGDVHFLYLDGFAEDASLDVALVLVRPRGFWESLRAVFRSPEPEVLETAVEFGDETGDEAE